MLPLACCFSHPAPLVVGDVVPVRVQLKEDGPPFLKCSGAWPAPWLHEQSTRPIHRSATGNAIISRIEFAVVRMAILGRSHSKLMVLKNINNGQFPQYCHIHGLIQLPLHTRTVRTKRHRQGKAHLIGGAVAEHGDGHVLASPIKLHAAVLMVFCSQRETDANSALRSQDSVAAEEVGGAQMPDQSGEQQRSRKGCSRTCAWSRLCPWSNRLRGQ